MNRDPQLYQLLPEYVRFQDQENGQALEALMGVLDLEFQRLHAGMERLYDDWFIETCAPWLVPFIGDLVGLDRIARSPKARFTWRPLVAKMIARRRFKGTVTCLEHTASDATGWSSFARWQAETIGWTQDVRATKPGFGGFLDLRDALALERLQTPFDDSSHTVDVRSEPGSRPLGDGCRFHPLWVSAWLWRIESRPIWRGAARRVGEGCYTFDPFGQDVPLYVQPQARPGERQAAREIDLQLPLRTPVLARLLDELRRSEVPGQAATTPIRGWLQVYDASEQCAIPLRSIMAWDLEHWRRPGPEDVVCGFDEVAGHGVEYPVLAAVDPERGRLTLAPSNAQEDRETSLLVSYSCGLGCDVGGGPDHQARRYSDADAWRALVLSIPGEPSPDFTGPPVFDSLEDALAAWPREAARAHLRIIGSGRLDAPSGTWHLSLEDRRSLIIEASEGSRPFLVGELVVCGRRLDEVQPGVPLPLLNLAGLWLDGGMQLKGAIELDIESSTLGPPLRCARGRAARPEAVPRSQGMLCASDRAQAFVRAQRSILGPIRLPAASAACEILDCVLDGALWHHHDAVAYAGADAADPGPPLKLRRTTVLGALSAQSIESSDGYFSRRPDITRTSVGFLEHCFAPPGDSKLPPESRQLPPVSADPCCPAPGWEGVRENENWLSSIVYGDPGYALLSTTAPAALMSGGTDGSAVGVTHRLYEAERLDRLPVVFENTLRSGMQAHAVLVDGSSAGRTAASPTRHHRRTRR